MSKTRDDHVQMPLDWDDIAGWDRYYEAMHRSGDHLKKMTVDFDREDARRYIEPLKQQGWLKIWLPGCGASVTPGLFAQNGFTVWASDASAAAIQLQDALRDTPADELPDSPPSGDTTPAGA
jgi:hypothetical protein